MTKAMMDLRELVEKSGDADLLKEMIGFAAERLMELEVGVRAGAAYGAKPSAMATGNVTGRPGPAMSNCGSRSCAQAATSRPSWSLTAPSRKP